MAAILNMKEIIDKFQAIPYLIFGKLFSCVRACVRYNFSVIQSKVKEAWAPER